MVEQCCLIVILLMIRSAVEVGPCDLVSVHTLHAVANIIVLS